jgi:hypothetical protein
MTPLAFLVFNRLCTPSPNFLIFFWRKQARGCADGDSGDILLQKRYLEKTPAIYLEAYKSKLSEIFTAPLCFGKQCQQISTGLSQWIFE